MTVPWIEASVGIQEHVATSADEFLAILRRSNSIWWTDGRMPWAFRGHALDSWSLVPSAWRPSNQLISKCRREASRRFDIVMPTQRLCWVFPPTNLFSGDASFGSDDGNLKRALAIDVTAELMPIFDFVLACDERGLATPLTHMPPDSSVSPNWLWEAELPLMADQFLRYNDIQPLLALAQHHRLPTRLLDWTLDPIAASFFAIEPLKEPTPGAQIVVWALHRERAVNVKAVGTAFPDGPRQTPRMDPSLLVLRPSVRDNPYLSAQSGLFTSIGLSGIHYMQNGGVRPGVEDMVAQSEATEPVLRKLLLSHDHVADLANILARERVSRSAFMPTMDNIAADVAKRWADAVS